MKNQFIHTRLVNNIIKIRAILPTCCSQALLCQIPSFDLNSRKGAISQTISLHSLMKFERHNNSLVSLTNKARFVIVKAYNFLPSLPQATYQ